MLQRITACLRTQAVWPEAEEGWKFLGGAQSPVQAASKQRLLTLSLVLQRLACIACPQHFVYLCGQGAKNALHQSRHAFCTLSQKPAKSGLANHLNRCYAMRGACLL